MDRDPLLIALRDTLVALLAHNWHNLGIGMDEARRLLDKIEAADGVEGGGDLQRGLEDLEATLDRIGSMTRALNGGAK